MNIRPRAGELVSGQHHHPPTQVRFARAYFLAVGMLVPAPDVARPWRSQGTPEPCHVRAAEKSSLLPLRPITGPIPQPPLPRPAARLLAVMFAEQDVCCISQQALVAKGVGKSLPGVLRALVEAGFVARQAGTSRIPDTYRLLALAEVP